MKKRCLLILLMSIFISAVPFYGMGETMSDPSDGTVESTKSVVLLNLSELTALQQSGVSVSDGNVVISQPGTYQLSGTLLDGSVIFDTKKDAQIDLLLAGVTIVSSDYAALYIKKAKSVTVTLLPNTINDLKNTGVFASKDKNNVDAVIFSKTDLIIEGSGQLKVATKFGNGITGKDDLTIMGGSIFIDVSGHALEAKDRFVMEGGDLQLYAGKDTIHAENDDNPSLGLFTMNSGTVVINAGDDAIHAGASLTMNGGYLDVQTCAEGLEAEKVYINGGDLFIQASDDCINATVGAGIECYNGEAIICFSGGNTVLVTEGDGLDSNGDILINGGSILIHGPASSRHGSGAIDYANKAEINGGTFIALTVSGKTFSDSSVQASFKVNFSTVDQGTNITVTDSVGKKLLSETALLPISSVIFSSADIHVEQKYTVSVGNTAIVVSQRFVVTKLRSK